MNIIEDLFSWFVDASVRGSIMALVVLLVRLVFWKRLSAVSRYALWLPVVVVLSAPWLPSSRLSAERWFAARANTQPVRTAASPNVVAAGVDDAETVSQPVAVEKVSERNWSKTAAVIWFGGCTVFMIASITAYLATLRRIRAQRLEVHPFIEEMLREAAAECGIARPPRLLISAAVTSPALSGFLRPILLLPREFPGELTSREAHLVLVHELIHLRRWDLPLNWVLCLLQTIHWCNPLLWFVFSRIRADREAACDAQVLDTCRHDARSDYGHALLKLESVGGQPVGLSLGFVGIFEHGGNIRARVCEIAGYRKSHPVWTGVSTFLVAAMLVLGASRAEQPPGKVAPAVTSSPSRPATSPQNDQVARERIQRKLNGIIIPKLQFRETTAAESFAFLERKSRELDTAEADPAKRGVKFTILPSPSEPASDARITISLANIPLVEAVKYVTSLANLKYRVRAQGVEIAANWPGADLLLLFEFKVDPKALAEKGLKPTDDVKQFLTGLGVKFPEGATAAFASENHLIVKAKQEDIDLIQAWLAQPASSEAAVGSNETKPLPASAGLSEAATATTALQRKLDTIVIPKIEFRLATVREAVDFLKRKSGQLDTQEPDPAKRGVSVVLKGGRPLAGAAVAARQPAVPGIPGLDVVPPAPAAAGNDPFEAKITLSLADIPLGEAFRYVCSLANMQMKVEPHAVVLSPAGANPPAAPGAAK